MNAFETLSLPARFDLGDDAIEQAYLSLQRQWHPDLHAAKAAHERQAAASMSVRINDAYRIVKDPLTRAAHLLALSGIHVNTDHDTVKPAPALLMEVMELRERLSEGEADSVATEAGKAVASCLATLNAAFERNQLDEAAQTTLRLGYLQKILEEARQMRFNLKRA
jgi:molecular chaperone HscB